MTSTNTLGIRNGNQIVAYGATTKRTKEIDITITAGSGITTIDSVLGARAIFYADSAGIWRMDAKITFTATLATAGGFFLGIDNVVFSSATNFSQYVSAGISAAAYQAAGDIIGYTLANSGNIELDLGASVTGATRGVLISMNGIILKQEPTTYTIAANMEGAVNASVYIPAASATETGLVSTAAQTIAGVKTFSAMPALATNTPATAGAAGITGQIAWDASYIYVCVATNSWKRAGIAAGW